MVHPAALVPTMIVTVTVYDSGCWNIYLKSIGKLLFTDQGAASWVGAEKLHFTVLGGVRFGLLFLINFKLRSRQIGIIVGLYLILGVIY